MRYQANNNFAKLHFLWKPIFTLILVFPFLAVAEAPLKVIASYQSPPGTLNLILQNQGESPLNVELRELGAPDEKLAIPFWWSSMPENPMAPNAQARMTVSLTRPLAEVKPLTIKLMANQDELTQELIAHANKNFIRYAVQDSVSRMIYLYLVNGTEFPRSITGMRLNGIPLSGGNSEEALNLPPNRGGMFYGASPELIMHESGYLPLVAQYGLGTEPNAEACYLFSSKQYVLGLENRQNFVLDCPTHKHGLWKEVGNNILAAAHSSKQQVPTVHFCRDRLSQGLPAFAQATPRIKINPQASNISRGKLDALSGYGDVLELARRCAEPGMSISIIENTSIFSGDFGALRNPEDAPLSARELLIVTLGALAHGAKGVEFRVEESDGEEYAQRVQFLLIRLELLRPFLSIGEILPMELKCSSDKFNAYCMLCGDKGVLLFILQKDFSDKAPFPPFSVTFEVPPFLALESFTEVSYGKERGVLIRKADNSYVLDVKNFDTAALYFCKTKSQIPTQEN